MKEKILRKNIIRKQELINDYYRDNRKKRLDKMNENQLLDEYDEVSKEVNFLL